jgi:tetratricopeptide (TPR) repeat protein
MLVRGIQDSHSRWRSIVVAVLAGLALALSAEAPGENASLMRQGKEAFERGDFRAAQEAFATAVKTAREDGNVGETAFWYLRSGYELEEYEKVAGQCRKLFDRDVDLGEYRAKIDKIESLCRNKMEDGESESAANTSETSAGPTKAERAKPGSSDRRIGFLSYAGAAMLVFGGVGIGVGCSCDVDADARYDEMLATTYHDTETFLEDAEELTDLERRGATWKSVGLSCLIVGAGSIAVDLFTRRTAGGSAVTLRSGPRGAELTLATRW